MPQILQLAFPPQLCKLIMPFRTATSHTLNEQTEDPKANYPPLCQLIPHFPIQEYDSVGPVPNVFVFVISADTFVTTLATR